MHLPARFAAVILALAPVFRQQRTWFKTKLAGEVPSRTVSEILLLATWNIRVCKVSSGPRRSIRVYFRSHR
jgi:hypothetical protein